MRWPHANSGLAVKARRLRSRFGISAPRLTVRTHVPWHWRAASVIIIIAASLALAGWIYDAGRSIAGFKSSAMDTLKARMEDQEMELKELRAAVNGASASLQIEQAAQEQFKKHTAQLEEENIRLKEELAVFENMAQGRGVDGSLAISRLRVEHAGDGGYAYTMLVTRQQTRKDGEFKGQLQFLLNIQQAGRGAMITLPGTGDPEAARYHVAFRNFHRLAGRFRIPEGAQLISVEARLIQDGNVKATQRITL
jgi:Sec-independent protein translocase protein TatA